MSLYQTVYVLDDDTTKRGCKYPSLEAAIEQANKMLYVNMGRKQEIVAVSRVVHEGRIVYSTTESEQS